LQYYLHQVINNPAQFILYEIWESQAAHLKQFEKPYILKLVDQLETILAKPYQVFMANKINS
jgi:quinol monooxygenase YgiN